jgi:hypothetical protein
MFHISEKEAVNIRDRIVGFSKRHFWNKNNWHLIPGEKTVYSYEPPTVASIFSDEGRLELFMDVSEVGFWFVLKQMKKLGTLQFGFDSTDMQTSKNTILISPNLLDVFQAEHIRTLTDDRQRATFRYHGDINECTSFAADRFKEKIQYGLKKTMGQKIGTWQPYDTEKHKFVGGGN